MRSGSTVIDVVEVDGETWDVREPGSERALSSWFSRNQAVREASEMLRDGRGGDVRVAAADGDLETIAVSAGRLPWWQMTRSPRSAFLLGGSWLMIAGTQLVAGPGDHGALRVFSVIMLLLALAVIASGVAQARRARR